MGKQYLKDNLVRWDINLTSYHVFEDTVKKGTIFTIAAIKEKKLIMKKHLFGGKL
jgi:hypothetical protein